MLPNGDPAMMKFTYLDRRLFEVEAAMNAKYADEVVSALVGKLGAASSTEAVPFQVKSGAVFPGKVVTWNRGGQRAVLRNPAYIVERLSVTLLNLDAEKKALGTPKPAIF